MISFKYISKYDNKNKIHNLLLAIICFHLMQIKPKLYFIQHDFISSSEHSTEFSDSFLIAWRSVLL